MHVDPPAYGSAYALYNLAYTGGMAVAPLLSGGLAVAGGVAVATSCAAAAVALAGAALVARRERSPAH